MKILKGIYFEVELKSKVQGVDHEKFIVLVDNTRPMAKSRAIDLVRETLKMKPQKFNETYEVVAITEERRLYGEFNPCTRKQPRTRRNGDDK